MVGVAQLEERRSAKPRQPRVRIPPRPPRRIRCAGCQKWESPNLSKADSRQRPPAGVEPYPAVIWDSSEDISRQLKSCCKAMRHKPCWRSAHLMKRQMPVRVRPVPPRGIRILQWVSAPAKRYWLLYVAAYNLGISACCDRRRYGSVPQRQRAGLIIHATRVRPPAEPPTPKPCVVHGSGLMPCPDGSIRLTS